ncbi:transcriptional regulator [Paraburkholderia sediminicola]|uniref:transcriptional regulator n=1 Tax=Paraburkholderia sediminicola TaxID=458836 RepID=UPI0038BA5073
MSSSRTTGPALAFSRFVLERNALRNAVDGTPIALGARALELLYALAEARGRPLPADKLARRGWPGQCVDVNTVQVQISLLRRALGDERDLIVTVSGAGYRLAADVRVVDHSPPDAQSASLRTATPEPASSFVMPGPHAARLDVTKLATPFIGRHAELSELLMLVPDARVVTLTGGPGVGKTRLAHEAARRLAARAPAGVVSLELPAHLHPCQISDAFAMALGVLPMPGWPAHPSTIGSIRERHMLLIVDSGDAPVAPVRSIIETLSVVARSSLRFIVIQVAPLGIDGEAVVRLEPLQPPEITRITTAQTPGLEALRLLIARIGQLLDGRERYREQSPLYGGTLAAFDAGRLTRATLVAAAQIVWRLDGIPLALELAAAALVRRVRWRQTLDGIDTLAALDATLAAFVRRLDASPALQIDADGLPAAHENPLVRIVSLSIADLEDVTRQRLFWLSVFSGDFSRRAAHDMLACCEQDSGAPTGIHTETSAAQSIDELRSAGLIGEREGGADMMPMLRLPTCVRVIALAALRHAGEFERAAVAHARSHVPRVAAIRTRGARRSGDRAERADLDGLRAALEWAVQSDRYEIAITLLDASEAMWQFFSLEHQYIHTIQASLAHVRANPTRHTRVEMRLNAMLARARVSTGAPADDIRAAWKRTYELANACADAGYVQLALAGLQACERHAARPDDTADPQGGAGQPQPAPSRESGTAD